MLELSDRRNRRFCANWNLIRQLAVALFLLGVLAPGLAPAPALAQEQAQSYRFTSIVVTGNQRVADSTVLSYAGIAPGQTVTAAELNAAYQRILASGLFEKVTLTPRGARLVIAVVEYPTINRISIEGNSRLTDEQALEIITAEPRRVLNPAQIERDANALVEAYRQQGRMTATVRPRLIKRTGNRVDVVFEINEGRVVEVERISFVGNRAFSDARLRRVLETKQAGALRFFIRADTFIEDRIAFDRRVLRDFYQARGYVDFQVLSVASEFSRERNAFFITFNVREGQQFRFGEITTTTDLPGVDAAEFAALARIRSGKIYSPEDVDNAISRMEDLATRKGLAFMRVEPVVSRNDRELTLDIEFRLVRGPRVFVERIDISGNTGTLDRVIRRQFRIVEGDPFNPREIRAAAQRIRALNLFASTEVSAREGSAADQVIVDVTVEEQPTGSLSFGAAYNFTTGIGLTASFSERNFLGRGQTLVFDITLGLDNANGGITFIEPAFLGRDLAFRFDGEYRQTEFDYTSYDTQTLLFSPSIEFPVSERGRLGLRYTLNNNRIYNVDAASSPVLQAEEAQGALLASSVGYTFRYDTRNTGFNPDAGILLQVGQDIAGLGGDVKYLKTTATLGAETRIIRDEVTLRATLEGGALQMFGRDSRVTDRFFLDPSRMRGFKPAGVGPRDLTVANQDALGGNYFAVARFEAEFPIGIPEEVGITAGLFFDIGSVWGLDNTNGGAIDDALYLRSTAGISIFWKTGLGPLRFNFSRALRKMPYDQEQTFDLTIATQF